MLDYRYILLFELYTLLFIVLCIWIVTIDLFISSISSIYSLSSIMYNYHIGIYHAKWKQLKLFLQYGFLELSVMFMNLNVSIYVEYSNKEYVYPN